MFFEAAPPIVTLKRFMIGFDSPEFKYVAIKRYKNIENMAQMRFQNYTNMVLYIDTWILLNLSGHLKKLLSVRILYNKSFLKDTLSLTYYLHSGHW